MTCDICGRESAPDRETGYDADTLCPSCMREGWTETTAGVYIKDTADVVVLPARTEDDGPLEPPF